MAEQYKDEARLNLNERSMAATFRAKPTFYVAVDDAPL